MAQPQPGAGDSGSVECCDRLCDHAAQEHGDARQDQCHMHSILQCAEYRHGTTSTARPPAAPAPQQPRSYCHVTRITGFTHHIGFTRRSDTSTRVTDTDCRSDSTRQFCRQPNPQVGTGRRKPEVVGHGPCQKRIYVARRPRRQDWHSSRQLRRRRWHCSTEWPKKVTSRRAFSHLVTRAPPVFVSRWFQGALALPCKSQPRKDSKRGKQP